MTLRPPRTQVVVLGSSQSSTQMKLMTLSYHTYGGWGWGGGDCLTPAVTACQSLCQSVSLTARRQAADKAEVNPDVFDTSSV